MPVTIHDEPNEIRVLRISGTLKRSEFGTEQAALAGKIDVGPLQAAKFRRTQAGKARRH